MDIIPQRYGKSNLRENCKTYVSMFLGHKILLAIDPIQRLQAWELFLLDFPFYATHPPHKLLVLQLGFWTDSGHPTFPGMFTFSKPRHFSSIFADFNVLVARLFLQSNSQIFWIVIFLMRNSSEIYLYIWKVLIGKHLNPSHQSHAFHDCVQS